MNDPLEDQLRELRPGPLPARLRQRIAAPPPPVVVPFPRWRIAAAAAAAAAAIAAMAWFRHTPAEPEKIASVFAEAPSGEVIASRSLGMVTDGAQRAWEMREVERLDGQTLLAAADGMAILTQRIRREVVPVEIHFD